LGDLGAGGDGYCNLLFMDDLVAAILAALRKPELGGRAFNLALPAPPTWNEYFIAFAKALGAVPVRRVTRRRLALETKILAPPLKVAEMLAGRVGLSPARLPPAIPPSLLRLCRQEIRLDVRQAELALAVRWTSLEDGLSRAAQWCRRPPRS
jgi:2-alkyl-3-oxoalkanoate reductase